MAATQEVTPETSWGAETWDDDKKDDNKDWGDNKEENKDWGDNKEEKPEQAGSSEEKRVQYEVDRGSFTYLWPVHEILCLRGLGQVWTHDKN